MPNIKPYFRGSARDYSHEHRYFREKTKLKPMYIVRYADDFKIFTNSRSNAEKIFKASAMWLQERLKLPISYEKSKVTNLKKDYSDFLGFKLKARKKGKKQVAETHISDSAIKKLKENLKQQIKNIQKAPNDSKIIQGINKYNSMVIGLHNYYGIANQVNLDLSRVARQIDIVMYNRFQKSSKRGKTNTNGYTHRGKYTGKDKGVLNYTKRGLKSMRYYMQRPILPIGDIKARNPMQKRRAVNKYTEKGRKLIHKELEVISQTELFYLRNLPLGTGQRYTVELYDNRIALYIAQKGKCSVSGMELLGNLQVHHKKLWSETKDNSYKNLTLITNEVHKLIHATQQETIKKYLAIVQLTSVQMEKLNKLRKLAGNPTIN